LLSFKKEKDLWNFGDDWFWLQGQLN